MLCLLGAEAGNLYQRLRMREHDQRALLDRDRVTIGCAEGVKVVRTLATRGAALDRRGFEESPTGSAGEAR